MSGIGLGLLTSAYFYPYTVMQVPVGILSDRWGVRNTATVFGLIAALGALLFGLSTAFSSAIFSRVLIGLGVSAIFVPAMKVFGTWFGTREYAQVSGLFMAIGTMGWFMGTTPLAALSEVFNWRDLFIVVALITVFFTIMTWFIVRDRPQPQGPGSDRKVTDPVGEENKGKIRQVLAERRFWPLAIWSFLRVGILFGFFGLWAGPYLMDVYGLGKMDAGKILSVVPLAIIVGTPLFGYLSDKVLSSRKYVLVGSSLIHCMCWVALLAFYDSLSSLGLYIIFFATGMMAGSPASVGFSAVNELYAANMVGTSIGAANLSGFLGGLVFQPFIGCILDKAGRLNGAYPSSAYMFALLVFLIVSVMALISVIFTRETLHPRANG